MQSQRPRTWLDALWQWDQAFDLRSALIINPDLGYDAVVLTNSDWLNPDVAINIARRASQLEFNLSWPEMLIRSIRADRLPRAEPFNVLFGQHPCG